MNSIWVEPQHNRADSLNCYKSQIALWDRLEVPDKGGHYEAFDRSIGGADNWVRGRKHRTGQCRGVLPIRCVSCRVRRKARNRAAAATGRASRGDPRRWCRWCRSTAWNTHESWRPGQPRRQALKEASRIIGAVAAFVSLMMSRLASVDERVKAARALPDRAGAVVGSSTALGALTRNSPIGRLHKTLDTGQAWAVFEERLDKDIPFGSNRTVGRYGSSSQCPLQ